MAKRMSGEGKVIIGWVITGGIIALILLILAIIFGNLSGNVGFDSGTQGYNDTENIILNYTTSAVNTAKQLPTAGTIIGLVFMLAVLLFILVFAIRKMMAVSGSGGSNANFS